MFGRNKKSKLLERQLEERLYEIIATELRDGVKKDGLWLKALAKSGGDENRTKSEYVRLRMQSLRDEVQRRDEQIQEENDAKEKAEQTKNEENIERTLREKKEKYIVERVDANAAENSEVMDCLISLVDWGYKPRSSGSGWLVGEPYGGKKRCGNVEELGEYVGFLKSQRR